MLDMVLEPTQAVFTVDITHQTNSFCAIKGTGGTLQALYFEGTASTPVFAVLDGKQDEILNFDSFVGELKKLRSTYGLGKDQLALMLKVSRPTLDSWLKGQNVKVQNKNLERFQQVKSALAALNGKPGLFSLGAALRKRLDEDCAGLYTALTEDELEPQKVASYLNEIIYRLEGARKAAELDDLLIDVQPFA